MADQSVRKPVSGVVDIPDHSLFEDEASRLWAKDRVHLGVCVANVEALNGILDAIEGQGKKSEAKHAAASRTARF